MFGADPGHYGRKGRRTQRNGYVELSVGRRSVDGWSLLFAADLFCFL